MPPVWFTPEQYAKARQYYWQKLEEDTNLVLMDIPNDNIISYFDRPRKKIEKCQYDVLYHLERGWDQHMWRSDRSNPKHIQELIHNEEDQRVVPVLTSSIYGHRKRPLEEKALFLHKRTRPTNEFYRVNGVNMKPFRGLPRESKTSIL